MTGPSPSMSTGRALLVGVASSLWHLPPLLRGAGLEVESITVRSPYFRLPGSRGGASSATTLTEVLTQAAEYAQRRRPDLVVTSDDLALRLLRDCSALSDEQRLLLAPVLDVAHLDHLASKVNMTETLDAAGVPVPTGRVCYDAESASAAAEELGWPVVLKNDFGAGGRGVRIAATPSEVATVWPQLLQAHGRAEAPLPPDLRRQPRVLVQRHIGGQDLDLSAFFRQGRLVHYSKSRFNEVLTANGASSKRTYLPTALAQPEIIDELNRIGTALGLNGFASITARESHDQQRRWYFEVDARPNLWSHIGAVVGDDPVVRLRHWFATGEATLAPTKPLKSDAQHGQTVRMGHRSSRWALVRNDGGAVTNMQWGTPDAALVLGSALLRGPRRRR